MADIIKKIIPANDIQHGCAISHVTKTGDIHAVCPEIKTAATISAIESRLTNRFDDTDYYGTHFKPTIISDCIVWASADKDTEFSDGDPVGTWTNRGTKSYDFTVFCTNAAKRPTYKTNIMRGKPALLFDGTDDILEIDTMGTDLSTLTDFTVMVAFQFVTLTNFATIASFGSHPSANPQIRFFQLDDSSDRIIRSEGKDGSNSVVTLINNGVVSAGVPYVGTFHNDADGVATQYINMIKSGTHTPYNVNSYKDGVTDITELSIGAAHQPDNFSHAYVAEYVLFDRLLTITEKERVERYLCKKYGVALP